MPKAKVDLTRLLSPSAFHKEFAMVAPKQKVRFGISHAGIVGMYSGHIFVMPTSSFPIDRKDATAEAKRFGFDLYPGTDWCSKSYAEKFGVVGGPEL